MADAPKRKPAKRGPTKAAALKALGLTQEDLDALKALAALRNAQSNDDAVDKAEALAGHPLKRSVEYKTLDEQGKQEVVQTTTELLRKDDGQQALEDRPAPQPKAWDDPDPTAEPVWYVRNLRGVDVGFRLSRQQESTKKRTDLKPRGSRGDMVKLEPGDLKDPELQTQVGYGLVEVIPEGEALKAIKSQYTNAQTTVPAHIAALRNEYGKEYGQTNPVRMATDEEAFGIKVADLDPDVMAGRKSDKEIKRDGGIIQQGVTMEPVQNPRPGPIVSDGFAAQQNFIAPTQTDGSQLGNADEHAQQVDALARSKEFEGPGAGLGNVTVSVEPVRRVQ